MSDATRKGLGLVGASLLLGVLGDVLLRTGWGINFPIWLAVAVSTAWALRPGDPKHRISGWPVATALLFSGFLALRDSEFLRFWNTLAVMGALSLPLLQARGIRLNMAPVWDYALAGPRAGILMIRGFLAPMTADFARGGMGRMGPLAIGAVFSVPVLFVFGGLLLSADSGFAGVFDEYFKIDYEVAFGHVMATGILTWLSAGYLAALHDLRPSGSGWGISRPRLGIVEIGLPLGTVSLVFVAFLLMQINYLFGGEAAMNAAGLTYAEYAREGFTQLVAAATLVMPLLLVADWLFDKKEKKHLRVHRFLATTLVILVGLLMLSAMHRVALYVGQYGLSEIRLYSSVFVFWIGTVNVIFLATVLRGREGPFAFASVVSGIAILAALNLSNPEAIIARSQFQKASSGAELDADYLARLSADAIPVIVGQLAGLDQQKTCVLWLRGIGKWTAEADTDWRSWNLARNRAERAAREHRAPDLSACESPEPNPIPG